MLPEARTPEDERPTLNRWVTGQSGPMPYRYLPQLAVGIDPRAQTEDIGDDPVLNACALAYLSDDLPTDAVVARHPNRPPRGTTERRFWNASLDHTMWFHHPMRANEWHLHDFTWRGLVGTRGLSAGLIFDRTGRHVATVTQEVLIRPVRAG